MKNLINDEWKEWTLKQLKNNINKNKIKEILLKQNYSNKIIDELIYYSSFTELHMFIIEKYLPCCEGIIMYAQNNQTMIESNEVNKNVVND